MRKKRNNTGNKVFASGQAIREASLTVLRPTAHGSDTSRTQKPSLCEFAASSGVTNTQDESKQLGLSTSWKVMDRVVLLLGYAYRPTLCCIQFPLLEFQFFNRFLFPRFDSITSRIGHLPDLAVGRTVVDGCCLRSIFGTRIRSGCRCARRLGCCTE